MISEQFLQELKLRSDVEEIVGQYVRLKRGGRNLVGICPFHSEKSPSFTVYPDTQSFYCFGCGAGGDVISFIRRIEGLEYVEAVKLLADRAGLPMPEDGYEDAALRVKTRVLELNRQTARFFHATLVGPLGADALGYLRGRGLSDATIRHFGLGYAPDTWDSLSRHLRELGFTPQELEQAAVVGQRGKRQYDLFRGRVMFPIIDIRGNVIAFGGRVMGDGGPKYLNSPDTPVFKKSRNLFALNLAKSTKEPALLLAEGYMDVIALHQAGFANAVATLGTALTAEQARMMSQYAKQVVIAYDSDGAGQTATNRAINILGEIGMQVKVLSLQGAKDPDEFIKKFGSDRFRLLLDGSRGALDFELSRIRGKHDLSTSEGKVSYLKEFASFIAGIANPIERDVSIAQAALETDVSKEAVRAQVEHLMKQRERARQKREVRELRVFAAAPADKVNPERGRNLRAALAEERLIAILYKNPDYYAHITGQIRPEQFITPFNRQVFELVCGRVAQNRALDLSMFGGVLDDGQIGRVAGLIAAADGQNYTRAEADDYIAVILSCGMEKNEKEVAQMDDAQYARYIADLAAHKK